jgi:hypothetical protein
MLGANVLRGGGASCFIREGKIPASVSRDWGRHVIDIMLFLKTNPKALNGF